MSRPYAHHQNDGIVPNYLKRNAAGSKACGDDGFPRV